MAALSPHYRTFISREFDSGCHSLEGGLADDAHIVFGEVGTPCPFGYGVYSLDFEFEACFVLFWAPAP
jgi:hypothetical protein